jgi:DNA-directed RNA polymerase subunit RPC12/RpoP
MATRKKAKCKVDYSMLDRFTELLICSRCYSKHVHQPIRQLVSTRHRPLALCQECASKQMVNVRAPVLRIRQQFQY